MMGWAHLLASEDTQTLITMALREDIGHGDVTTGPIFDQPQRASAYITTREESVVCGLPLAEQIFRTFDPTLSFTKLFDEGDVVHPGDVICEFEMDVRDLLTTERVVLNFLMRLFGIAYGAMRASRAVVGTGAQVFDTRKTTPGWRTLEKKAVATGGAHNHRFGLHDAVLIKDNHLAAAGSIAEAVKRCREKNPKGVTVQLEVDRLDQLDEAIAAAPDIVLLDNFSLDALQEAVKRCEGHVITEASGGVTWDSLASIAKTGVNRISMGALTHSAAPSDLSLEIRS